jgi:hypothetical protein
MAQCGVSSVPERSIDTSCVDPDKHRFLMPILGDLCDDRKRFLSDGLSIVTRSVF